MDIMALRDVTILSLAGSTAGGTFLLYFLSTRRLAYNLGTVDDCENIPPWRILRVRPLRRISNVTLTPCPLDATMSLLPTGMMFVQNLTYHVTGAVLLTSLIVIPQSTAQQSKPAGNRSDWEGLKALYIETGGENWTNNSNWDVTLKDPPPPAQLTTWHGVTLTDGRVTELDLSDNGLTGILPAEVGNLSSLRVLDLQENDLSGPIGSWIGTLTALVKLHLQQNQFSGPIPGEIGNLVHLEYLNLRGNRLEGMIPEGLGHLQQLQGIWLHANRLSGPIPQRVLNLPNLGWLWVGENPDLSGILSLTDPSRTAAIDFYLEQTGLCIDRQSAEVADASVPEYACLLEEEWNALEMLYLATDGDHWIANTGWNFETRPKAETVEDWYGITIKDGSIQALRLELNHLDGILPPELGSFTKLEFLRIDGNPLYGPIPDELSSLANLKVLSATETQLCTPSTAAVQLWLRRIPTVLGLDNCTSSEAAISAEHPPGSWMALPLWMIIGLGGLAVLGTGAALIAAFRKNNIPEETEEDEPEVDPYADQWMAIQERLEEFIQMAASMSTLAEQSAHQSDIARDFASALKTLRSALDQRDLEIKRLQRGHDNAVFRKFVTRFIRVDQAIQYFLQNTTGQADHLESIQSLMMDALQECDVQQFQPEIGSDYRSAFGVAEHPKILITTVAEDDCQIVEILEPGYFMQGGNEKEVLIPARVAIYRFKPEQ